ncbi:DNA replication/repair protein RecF [Marinobacter sp. LV10MA510-1]|uniref:DNA replication/repair protein RecF n=1 Tax=Marinobacter sp. LV10MA510-1 TaxID=1415567 RepID=UPI000BF4CB8B|nr:DNA replication and repair protein RecF [Marinobacter sp. LV10MA510-1]PFG10591.1 DNA replication and repair protein RecF [Marinobacter sp. LV10MA510-1]
MALITLQTEHFRNLAAKPVTFSPAFNLIYGVNGSGKTSLLEAIGYLGLGRSFRVSRHQAVVQHQQQRFTVFGGLDAGTFNCGGSNSGAFNSGVSNPDTRNSDALNSGMPNSELKTAPEACASSYAHRLGISRNVGLKETVLRVDGEAVRNLSSLARHLPVLVIDPGVFDIVAGGPGKRRQFLDWLVFHVEPSFGGAWQQCQRVISQRNQTLRNGRIDESLMRAWDAQYDLLSNRVTDARLAAFALFKEAFWLLLGETDATWANQLKLEFYPGWDHSQPLSEVLVSHRDQERRMGHTLYGPNRADIRLKIQGRPVAEILSRGQQKTLVILMKIAQGMVLRPLGKQVTFLLDDINAELDSRHRQMLAEKLRSLQCQVFITSIEQQTPDTLWPGTTTPDLRMFHVEHGQVTEEH